MEKNNSSDSSMCGKIRQALASNPALRAIKRISSHQEPKPVTTDSNSPSSSPTNTAIQTKLPLSQHPKVHTEGAGVIPIKFDYSTPASKENGNSAVSGLLGQAPKVATPLVGNSERETKVAAKGQPQPQHVPMHGKPPTKAEVVVFPTNAGTGQGGGQGTKAGAFKGEDKAKPKAEASGPLGAQHGHGVHSEHQGKKPLDINDTFNEYIQRAKHKIRTVSNIGRGQSNPAPDHEAHGTTNKKENHKDHFSDFIHRAKKKLRTTTTVGKASSLKRG